MSSSDCSESTMSIFIIDAFTNKPFRGNPAAVCLVPTGQCISTDTKQKIASEMNLSETAFISTKEDGDTFQNGSYFDLSWFTPTCEVSLCGHATLATAAVLFLIYNNESEVLRFETASGTLKAKKIGASRIQIDLPLYKSRSVSQDYEKVVKAVVGSLPVSEVSLSESKKLLIRLDDSVTRQELEQISIVDSELLAAAPDIVGIIVTLRGSTENGCNDEKGSNYDYISRYFAPWMGVSEDPVTGSAHSVSSLFWSQVLGKRQLYTRQCSKRGGDLRLEVLESRVLISGDAVVVVRGKISF